MRGFGRLLRQLGQDSRSFSATSWAKTPRCAMPAAGRKFLVMAARKEAARTCSSTVRLMSTTPSSASVLGSLPASSIELMRKNADEGDALAKYHCGLAHMTGMHGFERDDSAAIAFFREAADLGVGQAQFRVGSMLMSGQGCEKNPADAVHYFNLASQGGIAEAQFNLGLCLERGDGIEQDLEQACVQYALAAKQEDMEAMLRLALNYVSGRGVQVDFEAAVGLLRQPATKGQIPEACFALGYLIINGQGTKVDAKTAEKYLTEAASQGLVKAQHYLAKCLLKGFVLKRDEVRGLDWLQKAATSGSPQAQLELSESFARGKNMEGEALSWLKSAAEAGLPDAIKRYADCLEKGELGLEKQPQEAEKWRRMATD